MGGTVTTKGPGDQWHLYLYQRKQRFATTARDARATARRSSAQSESPPAEQTEREPP